MLPSDREEHIEDALRKLVISGNGAFLSGKAGVNFTMYELQQARPYLRLMAAPGRHLHHGQVGAKAYGAGSEC
jgi:hypothetical protein